ncbi:MAG: hypothetical protein DCC75_10895 [Proteobacteria bacterium]|nr:MAG: hypothetical protein DCC75_10895 [Pseudomonadota bacterium]
MLNYLFALAFLLSTYAHAQSPCQQVNSLVRDVAAIRKLPIKSELECIEANEKEFRALHSRHFYNLVTPERLQAEERVYKLLGLIPPSYPYARCSEETSSEFVQAFYDIFARRIVLPSFRETQQDIIAHEIVHALQDQSFDLRALSDTAFKNTDSALALAAVVEGDAYNFQEHFKVKDSEKVNGQDVAAVRSECSPPAALEDIDWFPYSFGSIFVERLLKQGGTKELDSALRSVPQATSQIIHRDLYPHFRLAAPANPERNLQVGGVSYRLIPSDILGQFVIRAMLGTRLPAPQAILAAKGWQGDRVGLYLSDHGNKSLLTWRTIWISQQEADEFREALSAFISLRFGVPINVKAPAYTLRGLGGYGLSLVTSTNEVSIQIFEK